MYIKRERDICNIRRHKFMNTYTDMYVCDIYGYVCIYIYKYIHICIFIYMFMCK